MKRIGFLYPGYSAEDEYPKMQRLLPAGIELPLVHTSVGEDLHEVNALLDLGKSSRLLAGAEELQTLNVDAIVWACTSGSFVFGVDGAQQQVDDITVHTGLPASSTSLAFRDALHFLGLRKVAIAATYPREVTTKFVEFLQDSGIQVTLSASNEILTAALAGEVDASKVRAMVIAADQHEAEAILVPDTALHTIDEIAVLETLTNKPVLTANQVTLWQGLRLIDESPRLTSLGKLFNK